MKIAVATVMLFGLTANATPPKSKQDNTVQHWLAARTENGDFKRNYGFMKDHPAGEGQIAITLEGDGLYLLDAVDSIRDNDWFPKNSLARNQVEEIRIVCAPVRSDVSSTPRTVFPLKIEALSGRSVRIELACEQTVASTNANLGLAKQLLERKAKGPNQTVASFDTVINSCKKEPNSPECSKAKIDAGQLLASDLTRPLDAPVKACDVEIDAGLDRERIRAKNSPQTVSLDSLANRLDWNASELDFLSVMYFLRDALPTCGIEIFENGVSQTQITKGEKCISELKLLREYLKNSRNIEFLKNSKIKVDAREFIAGFMIQSETKNTKEKIAALIAAQSDVTLKSIAITPDENKKATGSRQEWMQALSTNKDELIRFERTAQSESTTEHKIGSDCEKLDYLCLVRSNSVEQQLSDFTRTLTTPGKCYEIATAIDSNGKLSFSATEVACKK